MDRQIFKPTEKQTKKWADMEFAMPADEEIKSEFARAHHGKTAGWGMLKSKYATSALAASPEYQQGLWQGKLDRCNGLDYSEERNDKSYNLGYYRGYSENIYGYLADCIRTNPNFAHLGGENGK